MRNQSTRNTQNKPNHWLIIFTCFVSFASLAFSFLSPSSFAASQQTDRRINVNTASIEDLIQLPGIGPALAARIVEFRSKHGPFKRPQEIIIVRGMSPKRYRQIAHLIRI